MKHRKLALIAVGLVATMVVPSAAIALSTSSSSSSSSASSSSSVSIGHSNVFGALALGAGGRARVDRADVALLANTPFLAADPCLATMRYRASYSASLPAGNGDEKADRRPPSSPFGSSFFGGSSSHSSVQTSIATPRVTDAMQVKLVRVMLETNGTLSQDILDEAFARQRERLVLLPCDQLGAMHVSQILMGRCIFYGRGCELALSARIDLDANGIDETERSLIAHALRR